MILKKVSWIAISGNGILAVLTIGIGVIAGSLAVIGAGIDTTTDIVASLVTLFAAVRSYKGQQGRCRQYRQSM